MKKCRVLLLLAGVAVVATFFAVNITEAKKPPKDRPPPPEFPEPPVLYEVTWLPGVGVDTYAVDINVHGTIVGYAWMGEEFHAVYWDIPDSGTKEDYVVHDLNLHPELPAGYFLPYASCITNTGIIAGAYIDDAERGGIFLYDSTPGASIPFIFSPPVEVGARVGVRGMTTGGTVVGAVRYDDRKSTIVGFVWNEIVDLAIQPIAAPYLPTDINDSEQVVGVIEGKSSHGDLFSWTLNWDNLDPAGHTDLEGPSTYYLNTKPVINDAGAIAAYIDVPFRGNQTKSIVSLLPDLYSDWEIVAEHSATRVSINDESQVSGTIFNGGFVYVEHTLWTLDNPKMILDVDDIWFTDKAVVEAAADVSDATLDHFSPVVGWHYDGGAFLLMPTPYVPSQAP